MNNKLQKKVKLIKFTMRYRQTGAVSLEINSNPAPVIFAAAPDQGQEDGSASI